VCERGGAAQWGRGYLRRQWGNRIGPVELCSKLMAIAHATTIRPVGLAAAPHPFGQLEPRLRKDQQPALSLTGACCLGQFKTFHRLVSEVFFFRHGVTQGTYETRQRIDDRIVPGTRMNYEQCELEVTDVGLSAAGRRFDLPACIALFYRHV